MSVDQQIAERDERIALLRKEREYYREIALMYAHMYREDQPRAFYHPTVVSWEAAGRDIAADFETWEHVRENHIPDYMRKAGEL